MLYWRLWNSLLDSWTEIAHGETVEASPPPEPVSAAPDLAQKYDYLTEYGTQILCLFDRKGCQYLSRNFETLTGQKCDAKLGKKFFGLMHADYRDRLKELLESPKIKPSSLRCKLQHTDKKWYWYSLKLHPRQQEGTHAYVGILENIHDTMLAQNTLQKAKLEAELALRARSEFLSNMSHELRTPLNAVIGFSQIIESEMFGKIENVQYREYIRHIQESGYDLLAKIEDLLEIANIEAGRVALNREEVYADDILRHVREAQLHHAQAARVLLEAIDPAHDLLLHVDRLKLQHILGHLVANAIQFAPGGKVTLCTSRSESGHVRITVQDTGPGIPAEKLDAITAALKEDYSWAAETSPRIGLGLALTREFVALHGGRVSLTSTAGEGTRVEIILPKSCIRAITVKTPEYLHQAVG